MCLRALFLLVPNDFALAFYEKLDFPAIFPSQVAECFAGRSRPRAPKSQLTRNVMDWKPPVPRLNLAPSNISPHVFKLTWLVSPNIQQFALVGSSSSLHSKACNALGASDRAVHGKISLQDVTKKIQKKQQTHKFSSCA